MRWGCCGGVEQADEVRGAGFDFLEVNVQAVLRGQETDEAWAASAPDPAKLPLPIEAANCLLPGALPVVGPERDLDALRQYMARVAARARQIGIARLVFGSGGARKRPDGVSVGDANDQIVEFLRLAGETCAANDVLLVIEHLNRGETNTINRLSDARSLAARAAHPGVALLVDSYHYGLENETDRALLDLGDELHHVHVAEPVGRGQPGVVANPDDAFDFDDFFCLLHKLGYDERVSIEAKWQGTVAEAGPATLERLKAAWRAAGEMAC